MPRGDKDYTDKQKREAEHIEENYEKRGAPKKEAAARAWASVNKNDGGGRKSGSGRGKHTDRPASKRGGGKAHKSGSPEQRTAAARKGWETRRKNQAA